MTSALARLRQTLSQDRLLAPVMTVVFAGVLVSTLVAYFNTRNTVEDLAVRQTTQVLQSLDREISRQVQEMAVQMGQVSQEEILRLALEDSYLGRSARVAAQKRLETLCRGGLFSRLHLMGMDGRILLSSHQQLAGTLDLSDRSYYRTAREGSTALETLAFSRVSPGAVLAASAPVRGAQRRVVGVLVGIMDLQIYGRDLLSGVRVGQSGGAYILSADGQLLAAPAWAGGGFAPGALAAQMVAAADGDGSLNYTREGRARMCALRRNAPTGWILAVEADEAEVLAPAQRLAKVSGGISLVTLVLVALTLGALRRVMASLRRSEDDYRTLTDVSPVGIVTLSPQGVPQYLNEQARRILELAPDAPLPRALELEDDRGALLLAEDGLLLQSLEHKKPVWGRMAWFRPPGGGRKALSLNLAPLLRNGLELRGFAATLEDITERARSIRMLHESEERFSTLFRLSPDSIALTVADTGVLVDVNESWTKAFGYTREQVLGRTVRELGLYAHEDDRQRVNEIMQRHGRVVNELVHVQSSDGRSTVFSLSMQGMRISEQTYRMTVLRDMSEQVRATERLRQSEERFSALFRLSPEAIFLLDSVSTVITEVNEAFSQITGYGPEDAVGHTTKELGLYVDPEDRVRIYQRVRGNGFVSDYEFKGRRKDGRIIHCAISSQMVEVAGVMHIMAMMRDVTVRAQAQEALRERENFLATLLESIPVPVFYKDAEGRYTGCNSAYEAFFGTSKEMLIGRSVFDMSPKDLAEIYHAKDLELFRGGGVQRYEAKIQTRSQGLRDVIFHKAVYQDSDGRVLGLVGAILDITDRNQSMEQLRQSQERFSRLFRLSPESIILLDMRTATFADANDAFVQVSGYEKHEVLGHSSDELNFYVDPGRRGELYAQLERDGHVDNFEFEARRKDGRIITCSMSCQIIDIGRDQYLMAMVRDITEVKKMQAMMVQTEKMLSIGGIAAGIAHEINNPLGIVLQAAQNLVQRSRSDFKKNIEAAERIGLNMALFDRYMKERRLDVFIQDIQSAAVRASAIIRHMLDFSRRSESRRKVCDLTEIIEKAIDLAGTDYDLKKSYDFRRIRISRDYDDGLPAVNCTETEIEQVLLNLLRNAAQALASMDPPVADPAISLRLRAEDGVVRIELEDNGPGMPPEVQRRAFEPFFTTKPPGVGTGLGLSVSYFIITKGHGGHMSVQVKPEGGTRFVVELPALPQAEA